MKKIMKAPNKLLEVDIPTSELFSGGYTYLASIKYDGLRTVIKDGKVLSSSGKETYKNPALLAALQPAIELSKQGIVFDGELCDPTIPCREHLTWKSSKKDSLPENMRYMVIEAMTEYDWLHSRRGFKYCYNSTLELFVVHHPELFQFCSPIAQTLCLNYDDFLRLVDLYNDGKHEGLMLREIDSVYKHGRTTVNEKTFFKFKYLDTVDAIILDCFPMKELNTDLEITRTRNIYGELETIYTQDSYTDSDKLGGFVIKTENGIVTKCRPPIGLTHEDYRKIWKNREQYIGVWVTFQKMSFGEKDKPRLIKNVEFRDEK